MNRIPRQFAVHQRGAASLIVAVLFLAIVSSAAVVMLDMGAGELHDSNMTDTDVQAELLAQAGLERAFYRFKRGVTCADVACSPSGCPALDGPYTIGSGQFTVNAAVMEGSNCRITVLGQFGTTMATMQGLAKPAWQFDEPIDYTGGGSSPGQFLETWTVTLTSSQGNTAWDNGANCPTTVCAGSSGESYRMRTNPSTGNQVLAGYAERNLLTPLVTTAGMVMTSDVGYLKEYSLLPDAQSLIIRLVDSSTSLSEDVWRHNAIEDNTTWIFWRELKSLTAGRTYDKIRIVFRLDESRGGGNRQIRIWADEIRLSL